MNYKRYLLSKFKDFKWAKNGTEIRVNCFNTSCLGAEGDKPDTKYHLYINVHSGMFICPRCSWKGNFYNLLTEMEGLGWRDIWRRYAEPEGISAEKFKTIIQEKLQVNETQAVVQHYEELPFKTHKIPENTRAYKYLISRGITQEKIDRFGLTYSLEPPYHFRIIVPFYEGGRLVYFVARTYIDETSGGLKILNPPVSNTRYIPRNEVIFNYNGIIGQSWCTICEGVFDAMTAPNGIAILGKYMSEQQMLKLKSLEIKTVVVMLDKDAEKDALKLSWDGLKKWGFVVKFCKMPHGKDPNSIGEEECKKFINHAKELDLKEYVKNKLNVGD